MAKVTKKDAKYWFHRGVGAAYWSQPYGQRKIYTGFFGGYKYFELPIWDQMDSHTVKPHAYKLFEQEWKRDSDFTKSQKRKATK